MLTLSRRAWATPGRANVQHAGQRVEAALVRDDRAAVRVPPVAGKKARHDAIPTSAVPQERAAGAEHARELGDDAPVIRRIEEEPERREEVEHGVEATGPSPRKPTHVAAQVSKTRSLAAPPGDREQMRRIVQSMHPEPRLGQKMRVAAMPTWDVQDSGSSREAQDLDQAGHLSAVARQIEDGLVLQQVVGIDVRCPPLARLPPAPPCRAQKKTGSRYTPKTSSIAARIS